MVASPRPGRRRRVAREAEPALVAQVRAAPDATLAEHCARWAAATGAPRQPRDDVAGATAGGLAAQKKSLIAAERDEAARAAWREEAAALDPADLVFVDETSTHTARSPRGARARRRVRAVWVLVSSTKTRSAGVSEAASSRQAARAASSRSAAMSDFF